MRKLKKLFTAVLTAALVLTSMTVVFADDTGTTPNADMAAALYSMGLYTGIDPNDPYDGLERALTTQESLLFLAKLFGYNDAAYALTEGQVDDALAKFDDAASISEHARSIVAYSAANGILNGMTDGERYFVGAEDTVTAARFATFMLKQMGYDVPDYKTSVADLAATRGSNVDAGITGDLTTGDAVGIMYGALTAEKAKGRSVIEDIIGDNADLRAKAERAGLLVPPPPDIEVLALSVKALNCKQLEVVFNQEMNRDSVGSESFYEIYDKGEGAAIELGSNSVSVSDDRKTVTITLNNKVDDKLTNASKAKVIIKKGIKAASGEDLAEDAIFDVEVQDGIIPAVVKAEATGKKKIRITFSEPVYDDGYDTGDERVIKKENFKVTVKRDKKVHEYEVDKAILDNNIINLDLKTEFVDGDEVEVTINNDGVDKKYSITDYAGYAVFKGAITFKYKDDTSAPVVTVKSASRDKVVLRFTKPVKGTNIKLFHTTKNDASAQATATETDYKDEITFTYDYPVSKLPDGINKLYLVNSDVDDEELIDAFGIKVPDQTLICVVETDDIPPVFISGAVNEDKSVDLMFNEKLDEEFAKKTENYEVRKVKDSTPISFSTEIVSNKRNTVTLNFDPRLEDNTEYQVLIKKARDIEGNKTTETFTYTFTTRDHKPPKVIEDQGIDPHCYTIAHDGKIFIVYSEPMNEAQMLDKDNYMVSLDGGIIYNSLGDHDSITKVDDRTAEIHVKELDDRNDPYIRPYVKIAPIMDLAGKRLYGSISAYTVKSIGGIYPAAATVKSAAANIVVLGFSKPVKGSHIKLYYDNGRYAAEASKASFTDEIAFTFDRSLPFGELVLSLKNSDIEDERLVDQDGIQVPDQTLRCVVEAPPAPAVRTGSDTAPPVAEKAEIEEAQLIAKDQIKIVFSKKMARIDINDFVVITTTPGAINVVGCGQLTEDNEGRTEAVLILDKAIATDAKDEEGNVICIGTVADPASVTESGGKLKPLSGMELVDKAAPEIVMWDHDHDEATDDVAKIIVYPRQYNSNNNTVPYAHSGIITIFFSEDIEESTLKKERTFDVLGFLVDRITAPAGTGTVVLEVTAITMYSSAEPIIVHFSEIRDKAGNPLPPGPSWQSTLGQFSN